LAIMVTTYFSRDPNGRGHDPKYVTLMLGLVF